MSHASFCPNHSTWRIVRIRCMFSGFNEKKILLFVDLLQRCLTEDHVPGSSHQTRVVQAGTVRKVQKPGQRIW